MSEYQALREKMVAEQIEARGIRNPRVLAAFREVPRELFVPHDLRHLAYEDRALPISHRQTISQPYVVAWTLDALQLNGSERVLDVGTGSGYAAAVLSRIVEEVVSIERVPALASSARKQVEVLGYNNVEIIVGDGSLGWRDAAPYDAIAVAAGGPKVPPSLLEQLAISGRIVMPIGPDRTTQQLWRITRLSVTEVKREALGHVRFVPLLGREGWNEETGPADGPSVYFER